MSDTKYDLDVLKALLKEAEESEEVTELPDPLFDNTLEYSVKRFIAKYDIKSGEVRVSNFVLFMIYRTKYTGVNNKYKLSFKKFFREMNKVFKKVRSGSGLYYLVNTTFDVSCAQKKKMKMQYNKYWNKRKKSEQQKK